MGVKNIRILMTDVRMMERKIKAAQKYIMISGKKKRFKLLFLKNNSFEFLKTLNNPYFLKTDKNLIFTF